MNQVLMDIDSKAINSKKVTYATLDENGSIGSTANTVCAGDDTRIPTQDENNALVGYQGATYPPDSGNPYVTIDSIGTLLGGNYYVGTITRTIAQGAGANVAYTGIGFQPEFIVMFAKQHHTEATIGLATGAGVQYNFGFSLDASKTPNYQVLPLDTTHISDLGWTLGAGWRVTLVSLDADGFTLTYENSGATDSCEIIYLVGK